jgi:FkbM family methyltransferase
LYSFLARTLGLATILFEPEPIHSAFLQRNAVSVGQAFSCALSDERGKMKFFLCGEANPGSSSLVLEDNANSETHEAISVDVSTFDEMASRLQIDLPAVKLIKIDVEGNEEHTLRGMNGYLSTPDSAPIWCEVRGPNAGRSSNSVIPIVSYMERFGFRPFKCVNRSFSPFHLGIDPTPGIFDLLFAVPSRHKKLLCQ